MIFVSVKDLCTTSGEQLLEVAPKLRGQMGFDGAGKICSRANPQDPSSPTPACEGFTSHSLSMTHAWVTIWQTEQRFTQTHGLEEMFPLGSLTSAEPRQPWRARARTGDLQGLILVK